MMTLKLAERENIVKVKSSKKPQGKAAQRHQARFFLIQALYQYQLAGTLENELIAQFRIEHEKVQTDWKFFSSSLTFILGHHEQLDDVYGQFLDRDLTQLDPIEKSILRLGVYELTERLDIPYRVVINEAVELAKTFGATDSHRYVNGILDKTSVSVRRSERT